MKKIYYSESTHKSLYSLFYSSKKKKNDRFRNHYHTGTELGLILKGSGKYVLEGESFDADAGDLFVVRSNERHCIPTITTDTLIAFNIHLSSYFLWNVCADYIPPEKIQALINSDIRVKHKITEEKIIEKFKTIAKLYQDEDDINRFEIRKEILKTVILISEHIGGEANASIPTFTRFPEIQKAIAFIEENYKRDIYLDDIAKHATMSRSYLSTEFKAVTGISPYNYLLTIRIEKAVEALKTGNEKIITIAYECGFTNLTAFNKAFKRIVGMTPTELRKSYK